LKLTHRSKPGREEAKQGYVTDIISDYAVEFLNREHAKPFVLYVAHKAVHGPFTPAPRHANLYENDPLPKRPGVDDDLSGKPAIRRDVGAAGKDAPAHRGVNEKLIRNQLRCLLAVDEGVGRILDALDQKKLAEDTIVIFTSDNGYFWNEHGLGDKRAAYEESIHVPLVMRFPRLIKPGARIEQMTLNVDVAPTLLELGGLKDAPHKTHGRSLVPLLKGEPLARPWRDAALFEYFFEKGFPRVPGWSAVRSGRWKYIAYDEFPEMHELYDLKTDPNEMTNVVAKPEAAEALKQMKDQLARLQDETK
jgi:N-acetylglucosamine-6-sulfatase